MSDTTVKQSDFSELSQIAEGVQAAELLHCLNLVEKHQSYRSCKNIGLLYGKMFPDSKIASSFSCAESKAAYILTFGLSPYLEQVQTKILAQQHNFVLLFDESLNGPLQKKQLDVLIHYWSGAQVTSRYLSSFFLGRAKADDLLEKLRESCKNLPKKGLLQLSMDGPNVNWSTFNKLQKELPDKTGHQLLNAGSCGLHIVHNAFQSGNNAIDWDLSGWMKALYYLFKDSPARRDDFQSFTGSDIFPLKFCGHRWLENVPVAERALEIWPQVKDYMNKVKGKQAS